MTKLELARYLAAQEGISRSSAMRLLDHVQKVFIEHLLTHGTAPLPGFGTFRLVETAPRRRRNPATGEPVDVPARRRVRFKAGKKLERAFI